MKAYTFSLILTLCLACGCSPANSPKDSSYEVIEWDSLEEEDVLSSDLCTMRFIRLQTAPDCILDDIAQMEMDSDVFFVMDIDQRVFMFNQEGAFLRQIGEKGGARNEYVTLLNFFLDKKQKLVNLVDIAKGAILRYNYQGQFVGATELSSALLSYSSRVFGLTDNLVLALQDNGPGIKYQYALINLARQKVVGHLLPFLSVGTSYSSNAQGRVARAGRDTFLLSELSDTIYQYTAGKGVRPQYLFQGPLRHASTDDLEGQTFEIGGLAARYLLDRDISAGISNMYMTKNTAHFLYRTPAGCYQIFYDLASRRGYKYDFAKRESTPAQTIWNHLIASSDESFICALDPTEYKEKQSVRAAYPDLESLLQRSHDGDNPILALVKLDK